MEIWFYIFKLLAGIGLFLFAMYLLEESLKNLSGRNFKIYLQRSSKNSLGAVAGGAIVTSILQSSSIVSLMVLAFVGAGIFTMKNALAIILGANLGTTIDSWVVATLGFKMDIEIAAYPAVCIGGILLILFGNRRNIKNISLFLLGFGILFIGLAFMKTAMEAQVHEFDFTKYAGMPLFVFLLIGFIITFAVQSSSVTMALTLSALNAGAIGFTTAAVIVLGSETGTTIKLLFGAIGDNAAKKRVALGNILFNIFLTLVAYIFLEQILFLITDLLDIRQPLIGLVTFSTLINLLAIAFFLPLLNPFTLFLERFFKNTDASAAAYIGSANIVEPETAVDLFRRETDLFIKTSMLFNLSMFDIEIASYNISSDLEKFIEKRNFRSKTSEEKYEYLKHWQGEIQVFYMALRDKPDVEQVSTLNQLISAVRSAMHSAKSMKDIGANIANLKHSSKDIKFDFFKQYQKTISDLYHRFNELMSEPEKATFDLFQRNYDNILNIYISSLNNFYKEAQTAKIEDIDITVIINFNRELFTSNKEMLFSIKDFVLKEKEAGDFNEILANQF